MSEPLRRSAEAVADVTEDEVSAALGSLAVTRGGWMNVVWAATSPESGRFSAVERRSDVKDLADRFGELRSRGQGYLEVRLPDRELPQLSLGFRGDHAVIHLIDDAEGMSLLVGDGTVPVGAVVDVPIMDDPAEFTGDFVLSVDRAWALVRSFIRVGVPSDLGVWCAL
ncbi:hypothetical protein ACIBVL_05110 [Streptomyces sp. NPDC049687]|uniref:hypothetical protein n=1 Tax=Streptomyces sp. NPDC049687 TaxID=3365596 RepID=UPI00378B69F7